MRRKVQLLFDGLGFFRKMALGLSVLFLLVGCASTQSSENSTAIIAGPETTFERTTLSKSEAEYPFNIFPRYRLAASDVLDVLFQIRTWTKRDEFLLQVDHVINVKSPSTPELDEQQQVRPDGTITLPYIGEKYVVGKTVAELTKELRQDFSTILQEPDIYVVVPDFRASIKELKTDLHTAPRGLSRLVTIRPDGYVTFPMVGEMYVVGKTITEVNKDLNVEYEKILEGLHCDLFLEKHSGAMVYVAGEVVNPGAYKINKPITVIEAITMAGGNLNSAQLKSVVVARKTPTKVIATKINIKDTLALKPGSRFVYLQPDDIVYVPKTAIHSAAEVANAFASMLLFRGWNLGVAYELRSEQRTTIR